MTLTIISSIATILFCLPFILALIAGIIGMFYAKSKLKEKLNLFNEFWTPKIVGDLNDSYVKLAKFKGEFVCINMITKMNYFW